jgi:purine-binding chemotaxis protein CheW
MNTVTQTTGGTQFVTIGIGQEVFAVPVEAVVEILDLRPVARLPEAPAYLAGLIDVRGRSVPVIDLRVKLGLTPIAATESTRILVLEIAINGRHLALGLIADRVFEVITLAQGEVEAPPDIGVKWRSDYISGVGRRAGGFVIIFDLPNLFSNAGTMLIEPGGLLETAAITAFAGPVAALA